MTDNNMLRPAHKQSAQQVIGFERSSLHKACTLLWVHRWIAFITSLVVAIALSFPAALLIASRNLQQLAGNWQEDLHVQLVLSKEITPADQQKLVKQLQKNDRVRKATLISAEEGLKDFDEATGLGDAIYNLGTNPLPDVILIEPVAQNPELLSNLVRSVNSLQGVAEVQFDQTWVQTLRSFFDLLGFFTNVILQLLLMGLFVLIAGNVNALVARSEHEIRVMKLIGASDGFVSRPYLYFGALLGLLGGIIALGVVLFTIWQLGNQITALVKIYSSTYVFQKPLWWELLLLVCVPGLLGTTAALFSCRSAMAKASPDYL